MGDILIKVNHHSLIMVHIIVPRRESRLVDDHPSWTLVFGRRKTGKTFLIDNFVKHDTYFSIRPDRSVFCRGYPMEKLNDPSQLLGPVTTFLKEGKTLEEGRRQAIADAKQALQSEGLGSMKELAVLASSVSVEDLAQAVRRELEYLSR